MYVFIAYKPSFNEVSSELLSYHSLTEEELLFHWAQIIHENVLMCPPEKTYYIQVFKDSKLVWDELHSYGMSSDELSSPIEDNVTYLLYKKVIAYYERVYI